tara:strand:- start:1079 stop:2137 length:1059 start_codon:yes stop_codon:yes gene_type:complete
MKNIFKNKIILITGASGTIGSAIVLKILKLQNFKVVRAMSNDENGLHELLENIDVNLTSFNLSDRMKKKKFRILYGDIRDYDRCLSATKNVDIVIHAAAMKHISICEYNPEETIKTNIFGTKNILNACKANKVRKLIIISTDKAAYPTNDMGKSKKKAEDLALNFNKKLGNSNTKVSCVRFGNVLGSRGSVIPRFIKQIYLKKTILLSSKNMTRFVMTIDDAVRLIFKSLKLMKGNEIFIFKSMYSIKILDLAEVLKKFYSKYIKNINIKIIGVNVKEKFSEILMTEKEYKSSIEKNDMYIINFKRKKITKKLKYQELKNIDSKYTKSLKKNQMLKILTKNKILSLSKYPSK